MWNLPLLGAWYAGTQEASSTLHHWKASTAAPLRVLAGVGLARRGPGTSYIARQAARTVTCCYIKRPWIVDQ